MEDFEDEDNERHHPNVVPLSPLQQPNGHDHNPLLPINQVFPFPLVGESIPRRPWIIPGFLLRRHVTMLVAPPGSGKSLLTLQVGMACAAGLENWAGWRPRQQCRVLVINSEEDSDEMSRRLWSAARQMDIPHDILRANFSFAEDGDDLVIARTEGRTKTVVRTPMLERIITTIMRDHIDIVVVDPFAETFVGDENSNSEVKWAAVLWREVARRTNAALLLVHHAKKYSSEMAGDMDAARGGGSLAGVARIVCTLFAMTKEEAEVCKTTDEDRGRYLRFDDGKANYTLKLDRARWFQKITVRLPNAGDIEEGDDVGVLMPWTPPGPFDDLDREKVKATLDLIQRGILDADLQPSGDYYILGLTGRPPNNWVGHLIMQRLNLNEALARKLIELWHQNGVLETFSARSPTTRKPQNNCVRVNQANRPDATALEVTL